MRQEQERIAYADKLHRDRVLKETLTNTERPALVVLALNVLLEIVQDAEPVLPLVLGRVFALGIERFNNLDAVLRLYELHRYLTVTCHSVAQRFVRRNFSKLAFKIKTRRTVLGLHPVVEAATRLEIQVRSWAAPIILGEVPMRSILRRHPRISNCVKGRIYFGFD